MNNTEQIKTAMSDLQVTVQLSYSDLKLLEQAKEFGVINPLDNTGKEERRSQVLELLHSERDAAMRPGAEHRLAAGFIDHLIKRIKLLP